MKNIKDWNFQPASRLEMLKILETESINEYIKYEVSLIDLFTTYPIFHEMLLDKTSILSISSDKINEMLGYEFTPKNIRLSSLNINRIIHEFKIRKII